MTKREQHKRPVDCAARVERADVPMRDAAILMAHPRLFGLSAAGRLQTRADPRNREQEERERLYGHRMGEAALLRSLAREACLQAQEIRWRSAQTRTVSATLRGLRSSNWAKRNFA